MKISCTMENAPRFWEWLKNRNGLALWQSANLSNPGASWTTPVNDENGKPYNKPTWQASDKPEIVTNPDDVTVYQDKEVKRFRVGTKRGDGLSIVLTNAASNRVKREKERAGDKAYHIFDYSDYNNCVILVPDKEISLTEYAKEMKWI